MNVFTSLGSGLRVQYKKCVIDTREGYVNMWFFPFFWVLSFMILKIFCFHFHFVHLGRAENAFFLATTMLILELIKKNGGVGVLLAISTIYRCAFHSHKI